MYIIIAKIMTTDKRSIEACRLYNTDTKEIYTLSLKKIKMLIHSGKKVVGFKTTEVSNFTHGKLRKNVIKERGKFNFNKVPEINGEGQLVNETDKDKKTVYGWKGFAEAKRYVCMDYTGTKKEYSITEFYKAVSEGIINGAIINPKTDKPIILSVLDVELN